MPWNVSSYGKGCPHSDDVLLVSYNTYAELLFNLCVEMLICLVDMFSNRSPETTSLYSYPGGEKSDFSFWIIKL